MSTQYRICNRCVMDTSDMDIVFDASGFCQHCTNFLSFLGQPALDRNNADNHLQNMVSQIKSRGAGLPYDCLVGISGGVDSCYTAHLCHSLGLRPLLLHMDNGWNSEIAVGNIRRIIEKLNLDYVSEVLDWNEFREIQLAFLKSSIVDLEMPTDIAILASICKTAEKYKIPYIVSGGNFSGEGILPLTWGYHPLKDMKLYRYIVRTHSKVKIRKTPTIGLLGEFYYKFVKRIKTVYPLNYANYDKDKAREFLKLEFGWQDYGGKHRESKITAFWQSYVMPTKYGMDYRRATYSSQICTEQMTRAQALSALERPSYVPEEVLKDKQYIAKKYQISLDDLERYLLLSPRTYKDFPNNRWLIQTAYKLYRTIFSKRDTRSS
jgi:N-acetyl sugar amidotransferase